MTLGFRAKLVASHLGVVVLVVVAALLQLNRSLTADLERQVDERLEEQAKGAAQWVGEGGHRHVDRLAGRMAAVVKADVTIFDRDGKVLGDSAGRPGDPSAPEVAAARRGVVGRATRGADRGGEETHFVAVPTSEGFVLRLAAPLSNVRAVVGDMRRQILVAALLAVVAAFVLAVFASRFASRPLLDMTRAASRIAAGEDAVRVDAGAPDDFGRLAEAVNTMAAALEERTVMRRDYLANVSHELRTPLSAIQGAAETLLQPDLDRGVAQAFSETIHRQARRIGELVEELATLTELEMRPLAGAELEPVDPLRIASLVAETLRGEADAEGTRIVVDDARVTALADPAGLERVLENLVDNALEYGRPGGEIRVSAARSGGRIAITVADDGGGIAAEHLPRVFERFYRVDPSRSRERGGAGLGLAIVKHHVERMGGTVRVESPPGEGARFIVDLAAA